MLTVGPPHSRNWAGCVALNCFEPHVHFDWQLRQQQLGLWSLKLDLILHIN